MDTSRITNARRLLEESDSSSSEPEGTNEYLVENPKRYKEPETVLNQLNSLELKGLQDYTEFGVGPLFGALPMEILVYIFWNFSTVELLIQCSLTCRLFYIFAKEDKLWKIMTKKRWPENRCNRPLSIPAFVKTEIFHKMKKKPVLPSLYRLTKKDYYATTGRTTKPEEEIQIQIQQPKPSPDLLSGLHQGVKLRRVPQSQQNHRFNIHFSNLRVSKAIPTLSREVAYLLGGWKLYYRHRVKSERMWNYINTLSGNLYQAVQNIECIEARTSYAGTTYCWVFGECQGKLIVDVHITHHCKKRESQCTIMRVWETGIEETLYKGPNEPDTKKRFLERNLKTNEMGKGEEVVWGSMMTVGEQTNEKESCVFWKTDIFHWNYWMQELVRMNKIQFVVAAEEDA